MQVHFDIIVYFEVVGDLANISFGVRVLGVRDFGVISVFVIQLLLAIVSWPTHASSRLAFSSPPS